MVTMSVQAPHSHLTPASSNASDLPPEPDPPPNASPIGSDLAPVVIKTAAASTPSPSVSLVRPEELSDSGLLLPFSVFPRVSYVLFSS